MPQTIAPSQLIDVHPTRPTIPPSAASSLIGLHPSVIEFMFQTTRMLTNMVVTGAAKRFSSLRMISTHAGGTLRFLARRIETLEHTFGVGDGRLGLFPRLAQRLGA